jgi:hypothetical protein
MSLYLLPLAAGLLILGVAFAMRLSAERKRGEREVAAGLEVVRGLRWKEFAHLVTQSFESRGYAAQSNLRKPGEDGVDMILTRAEGRVLLQVKHGGSYLVGAGPVRLLAGMLAAQQAQSGVIATSGAFDAAAVDAARNVPVTLLDGGPLWSSIKGLLPEALRVDAQERADMAGKRAQSRLSVLAFGGTALVLLGAGLWGLQGMEARPPSVATLPSSSKTAPAPAPPARADADADAAAVASERAAPVAEPTEAELAQQRDFAAAEALLVTGVASASWSSNSTLSISLRGPLDDQQRTTILQDICTRVVARDALRFTRLEVSVLGAAAINAAASPRWYPCR